MNKVLGTCALLALSAFSAKAEVVTLASTVPDTGINTVFVDTFTQEMSERLPDFDIEPFLDGTLGAERELIDLVKLGETQVHMGVIHSAQYYPELDATLVPYLFPDYQTIVRFLSSETGARLEEALAERGNAKFLGTYYQGSRWTTSNTPFTTLEELQGIKVRLPEIPLWIDIWSGLGVVTTPMPSPEVFSGLQTGVIDAQENMLSNIWGRRLFEVQDYLIDTQHQQSYVTVMANLDFWEGLEPDQQAALQASVDAASAAAYDAAIAENETLERDILASGVELIEPSPEFREKALPIVEKVARATLAEGIYEAAQAVIGAQP
ncbi:TRAP transporter substrate-binding protein [Falsirhodobacter halotolerans]|uniref:TRAP transporter substrate-binding protein n=1 Tax=Falsirhodobacter halotolerans TaxID=1146892 RepID=UPI001FD5B9C4|nr:TRAP transporter substrate-binding protein [Falsirhodobacter halotolerans]MCJ8141021.1 TRAP transporter substrate-binding protein [Falsirhodobacter halotolerans]